MRVASGSYHQLSDQIQGIPTSRTGNITIRSLHITIPYTQQFRQQISLSTIINPHNPQCHLQKATPAPFTLPNTHIKTSENQESTKFRSCIFILEAVDMRLILRVEKERQADEGDLGQLHTISVIENQVMHLMFIYSVPILIMETRCLQSG